MSNYQQYQTIINDQMTIPVRLIEHYKEIGMTDDELLIVLQIKRFLHQGNSFPTPGELALHGNITEEDCSKTLRSLIQKQFMVIEQRRNERNVLNEGYSLEPLWEKLYAPSPKQSSKEEQQTHDNLFVLFEQEFGRLLSPFEIETINIWLDQDEQEPALIKAALREAVLMGKLNFKYIDRILREWKKKGIKSVQQAREAGKQFRGHQKNLEQSNKQNRDVSLYYNWLDEE
ncbi:DnaD domain-containing protein [Thalassobacillus hwangdonensis]|uniref:DnaD domain-containing protein n=1 Tax=Thalassobacillus hwangdonensis TaxID=546108 RepID=A0ABW3KYZ3_9BACI